MSGDAFPVRPWHAPMSAAELMSAGCRLWENGHYLFPAAWFDDIPEGFEVMTILGKRVPFDRSMSRDTRFGMLSFGVTV